MGPKPPRRVLRLALRLIAAAAVALGVAVPVAAQQRSVDNPGFEAPIVTGSAGFQQIANGLVPGWEADPDPTIEIWRNGGTVPGPITAFEGRQFAEMNSTRPGALYQLVCFTNGETLRWSFAHRARSGGANPQIANYEIASATSSTTIIQTLASQSTAQGAGWQVNSNSVGVPFTGASGLYRLQFRTTNPGSVGNFLDAIQIQLSPYLEFNATSTSALEGAGAGASLPQILIDGNLLAPLVLNLSVTGGAATLGADYTTPSGASAFTVTIPVGNYNSAAFPTGIAITNDAAAEANETIAISIGTSSSYQVASATTCGAAPNATLTHTILDEDTAPAIDVVKTGALNDANGDGLPQPGETITYAFTVTNTGNVPLSGITLSDSLPGVTISGGSIPVLGVGLRNSTTFTGIYTLTQTDINAGAVTNLVTVRGTGNNGFGGPDIVVTDTSTATTPLTRTQSIGLIKGVPTGALSLGNTLTYTITATNTGNVTLTAVTVTDALLTPGTAICGSVAPLGNCVLTGTYVITQDDVDAGEILNTADVTGNPPAGGPVTATSSVTTMLPQNPLLGVVKTGTFNDENGDGLGQLGETISYTFRVENTGNLTLTDITLTDPLPGISLSPGLIATLAPGDVDTTTFAASYALTEADLVEGEVTNQATATGTDANGDGVTDVSDGSSPAEDEDDPTVTPFSRDLGPRVTKTVTPNTAVIGETVRFTIVYRNSTATAYPGASLIDELPPGMAYLPESATIDGVAVEPEIDGRRLIWAGQDLDFNDEIRVELAVRIVIGAGAGSLTNQALLRDAAGNLLANIASATVQLRPEAIFDCTDVIGKVFFDQNGNGVQDPDDPRAALTVDEPYISKFGAAPVELDEPDLTKEPGIAGVRVVTVNGLRITTDGFGRFSLPCAALPKAEGSNFTLKLDPRTLPDGLMVSSENPRTLRLTAGKMARMNFAVSKGERVDISLTASAFDVGSNRPAAHLRNALDDLLRNIRATPTILRLVYLLEGQEQEATATARLRQVERLLRQIWMIRGTYPLTINKSVQRPE